MIIVPADRDVTYGSFVCDHRPLKDEEWRVRLVVGGNKLAYPDDPASPAANLLATKFIINSTIFDSNKEARFMTVDLNNFFLGSAMPRPEYMKIPHSLFPPDIISKYKLHGIIHNGFIYIGIKEACMASKTPLY